MQIRPIADLVSSPDARFVVRDGVTFLICSKGEDDTLSFPAGADAEQVPVGPEGVLYSFSKVHVSASRPVPYLIGYVDFPGNIRVLASVRGPEEALRCDCPVRLASDGSNWFVEPIARVGS